MPELAERGIPREVKRASAGAHRASGGMMTVRSIHAEGAPGYAEYLETKTIAPERGDYYLGRDGEPVEAPGRWLARPETLRALGVEPGRPVEREDLVALMQGRRPGSEEYVRRASSTGIRNAGVDVTLSAPKSVSVAWALASPEQRAQLEQLHHDAVDRTLVHLRDTAPVAQQWDGTRAAPAIAKDLIAAAFLHCTARGLPGRAPDPQLHSHVIVTSVVRQDGQIAAVRDRSMYRAAREGGAYYRAALAHGLAEAGYRIQTATGRGGRYFELDGFSPDVLEAFSGRSREIEAAVRTFEAREGRRPSENELQLIKVTSRQGKQPQTTRELTHAWQQTAREHQQPSITPRPGRRRFDDRDPEWGGRVEHELTSERPTFTTRELAATALEQAAGTLDPDTALRRVSQLKDAGRILALDNGKHTTRTLRQLELSILSDTEAMRKPDRAPVPEREISAALDQAAERLGRPISGQQERAIRTLTGPERIIALEGQAGTGKGVVIDATTRAEHLAQRKVIGVALAGATAQRLGHDSPALQGHTTTIASLLHRHNQSGRELDSSTTVILDEAGMVDTKTLAQLVSVSRETGARLIAVGDGRQLPAIGPGGMFDQLTQHAPKAVLTTVHRTTDRDEQKAWRALRNGQPEKAMAHYLARGQLHLDRDRDTALNAAAQRYDELTRSHGITQVALMSDGPTTEIDRLNARAQHLRAERGELGHHAVTIPGPDQPHYPLREGDLITWRHIQPVPGGPRVENGTRGIITQAHPSRQALQVRLLGSDRIVTVTGPQQLQGVRLGYAQHVIRQQGATVDRAVAVTGGWQTSRESAYVQASRARHGIDWHIPTDQLASDGTDPDRVARLADRMRQSHAKTPSIDHQPAPPTDITITVDPEPLERVAAPHPSLVPTPGPEIDR